MENTLTIENPEMRTAAKPSVRFRELDSLRGLAALTVVFHHFVMSLGLRVYSEVSHSPLRPLIGGHQAVLLFFVLSGFVLMLPFCKQKNPGYGRFILRRVCRIYLPYLAALALALGCDAMFRHPITENNDWLRTMWSGPIDLHLVWQHVLFIGSYDYSQFNTAFWSLVYEMRISLLFPLLALAVLRIPSRWMIFAALCLSALVEPVIRFHLLAVPEHTLFDYLKTLHYIGMFICGAVLARNLKTIKERFDRLKPVTIAVLYLIAIFLFVVVPSSRARTYFFGDQVSDWSYALGAMLFIVLALNEKHLHDFLNKPLIVHLGRISYSLYLVHATVLFSLVHAFYGIKFRVVLFPFYLLLTFGIAELFYRFVEAPSMNLGRTLTQKRTLASGTMALSAEETA